jgi:DNA repair exonuclease SbcCD nuclease subunit
MKKILYTTDEHITNRQPRIRTDDYLESMLTKLKEVVDYVLANDIDYWISGGDFFDSPTQNCDLINKVAKVLEPLKGTQKIIRCISGNHTIKGNYDTAIEKSGLLTLQKMGLMKVYKDPANLKIGGYNFILMHETVVEKSVPWDHKLYSELVDHSEKNDVYLISHYHQPQGFKSYKPGVHFISPGSLARGIGSERNIDRKPCFALITVDEKLSCEMIELKNIQDSPFKEKSSPMNMEERTNALVDYVKKNLKDFEIKVFDFDKLLTSLKSDDKIEEDVFNYLEKLYTEKPLLTEE